MAKLIGIVGQELMNKIREEHTELYEQLMDYV